MDRGGSVFRASALFSMSTRAPERLSSIRNHNSYFQQRVDTTAIIVNYATPDLTRMAVWSLRGAYSDLPIVVVDAGSPDDSVDQLRLLATQTSIRLIEEPKNVHHGPGMDLVLRQIDTDWGLVFDSDCILYRPGLLEMLHERSAGAYMVGQRLAIDKMGYPARENAPVFDYVHPKCALVHRETYHTLPPFEKHGVPCLTNELEAQRRHLSFVDAPVDDYVYHIGRGTASRHGYALGAKGRLESVFARIRRWIG
ncbi:MAG: glycosyltransferase [Bacteroidota bacterium]